ncbi:MAG: hypothetical protein ACC645_25175, partial [Pirellulales bacterium]
AKAADCKSAIAGSNPAGASFHLTVPSGSIELGRPTAASVGPPPLRGPRHGVNPVCRTESGRRDP